MNVGNGAANAYRAWRQLSDKAFSVAISGAFEHFGSRSVIQRPVRLTGESRMSIGCDVFVGAGSWLQVISNADGKPATLRIGDGVSIAGACVLTSVLSIRLEARVLLARNVYVADHSHAFADTTRAVRDQGVDRVAPVLIREGAWLAQNVVVLPGVTIGRGAVVGANSVVRDDVPDHTVAVGAPARAVRTV